MDPNDAAKRDDDLPDDDPPSEGPVTEDAISKIYARLNSDGLILRLDDERIARHFMLEFFEGKVWDASLQKLRDAFAALYDTPSAVPEDGLPFAQWVREELLGFAKLPRDTLAELYADASHDLAAIRRNLTACQSAIDAIERRTNRLDSDPVEIRFFRYYEQLNKSARDEIVSALESQMHAAAMWRAHGLNAGKLWGVSWTQEPWHFRANPAAYNPDEFSALRHAFRDMPVSERRALEALVNRAPDALSGKLIEYILNNDTASEVRAMISLHHLLDQRREILLAALDAYERGHLALFVGAVAVQIEGIIEDACVLSGVSYDALRLNTLVPKLDELRKAGQSIDFAYYAFKFQVLRNRVAHGRVIGSDLPLTADLLLLDLRDACQVVVNHPAASNQLVKKLAAMNPLQATVGEIVQCAAALVQAGGTAPSPFYALSNQFEWLKILLEQVPVWSFLEQLAHESSDAPWRDELLAGVRLLCEKLRGIRPMLRGSCTSVLKQLQDRGKGDFNAEKFAIAVKQQQGHDQSAWELHGVRTALLSVLMSR